MKNLIEITKHGFAVFGAKMKVIFAAVDWKDVAVRSIKTFFQAALAFASAALADGSVVHGVSDTLILSALAAGIAAVWNGVLSPAFKVLGEKADEQFPEE